MNPVNNQNSLFPSSGSEQMNRQANPSATSTLGGNIVRAPAMSAASAVSSTDRPAVADPTILKRKLSILTHDICSKILIEFLGGNEMALTLTCKYFDIEKQKLFAFLPEKWCASRIPPEHDPFRQLIQEARPDRLEQQALWKQLWILRREESEPWKMTQYMAQCGFAVFADEQGNVTTFNADLPQILGKIMTHSNEPPQWPGRRFDVRFIDRGPSSKVEDRRKYDNVLSIYDQKGKKISNIYCPTVFHGIPPQYGWSIESERDIVCLQGRLFWVWKPDMDTLLARTQDAESRVQDAKTRAQEAARLRAQKRSHCVLL